MTTVNLFPDAGSELPHQTIARRIRGIMADQLVTGVSVAEAMGMDQRTFSRRYRGKTPFTIDELFAIAVVLRVPFVDLVQSVEMQNGRPSEEDRPDVVRHRGLEPRTR